MKAHLDPLAVDRQFFTSLIEADLQALDRLLADDFMLIDVMSGSEITKSSLLAVMGSGQVKFEAIEPAENLVRLYHTIAVVTGRTQMKGQLGDTPFSVSSRYTHVYVAQQSGWRLVAAQGTKVLPAPEHQ
jgi:ketosteroid isomerase-like protein